MTDERQRGPMETWLKEYKQQYESDQTDYEFIRLEAEEWDFAREQDEIRAALVDALEAVIERAGDPAWGQDDDRLLGILSVARAALKKAGVQ